MSKNNIKIAVCISGLVRYWKITESLMSRWNDLFDVTFDFYLSTWKDGVYVRPDKNFGVDKNIDYDKCEFLTDYELVDSNTIEHGRYLSGEYFVKSINSVFDLLKRQDKKYDLVFWTRNDAIFSKSFIQSLINVDKKYKAPGIILNSDGMHKGSGNFSLNDYYFIGHQESMNVFCDIHRQFSNCENQSILPDPPFFLGQFFLDNKIYLARHGRQCGLVKSESHFKLNPLKRKLSTSINGEKLVQIINDKGVDYVLDSFEDYKTLKKLGV